MKEQYVKVLIAFRVVISLVVSTLYSCLSPPAAAHMEGSDLRLLEKSREDNR